MQKLKTLLLYLLIVGGFSALMYWLIILGKNLETGKEILHSASSSSDWEEFVNSFLANIKNPLALLLAQLVVIIVTARAFGWLFRKIKQPSVMGEIIAGIFLGPSFIGHYFPEFSAALFPEQSLGTIHFLSQIGLMFFMFIVGMELNLKVLKERAHEAVVISHASIIIPFTLGIGLAYFLYTSFAPAGVAFLPFALFMGIAMSITAFPVLARIVHERGMMKTRVGSLAITCAAVDDVSAWCILAAVIAVGKAGSAGSALYVILLASIYVLAMIYVVRPFLHRIANSFASQGNIGKQGVAVFILTLIISCFTTEAIGIHALFGAFMVGAIMPDNVHFRNTFIEKVEDIAVILLLPLFFVFSGLRTEIGLLNNPHIWKVTAVIIAVAVTGKFIGSAFAAKVVGQNWKDSLIIGALMNTRGLMELVALNLGYDLGLLTPSVFTMMVIMALVTTFMTGPALDIFNYSFKEKEEKSL